MVVAVMVVEVAAASTAVVEAVVSTVAVVVAVLITAEAAAIALLAVELTAALVAARIIIPARPIIIPVQLRAGRTAQWAAAPATATAPAIAQA